jgi:hypothetical protein
MARSNTQTNSTALSEAAARAIIDAAKFAKTVGIPLDTFASVDFPEEVPEGDIPRLLSAAMKNLRLKLRRWGVGGAGTAYIWVRERHGTAPTHVHILFHVPLELRSVVTNSFVAGLFRAAAGFQPGTIDDNALENSGTPVLVKQSEKMREEWPRYMAKAVTKDVAEKIGIRRTELSKILGRRYRISENIGERERFEWRIAQAVRDPAWATAGWRERANMAKRLSRQKAQ